VDEITECAAVVRIGLDRVWIDDSESTEEHRLS
jgi:hypothetical protein